MGKGKSQLRSYLTCPQFVQAKGKQRHSTQLGLPELVAISVGTWALSHSFESDAYDLRLQNTSPGLGTKNFHSFVGSQQSLCGNCLNVHLLKSVQDS